MRVWLNQKGVPGNGKAGKWAKLATEEPDAPGGRGVECLGYSDRAVVRAMQLPRSPARLRRVLWGTRKHSFFCTERWSDWRGADRASVRPSPSLPLSLSFWFLFMFRGRR